MSGYNDLIANINTSTIFCNNVGFGEQGALLAKIQKGVYVCPNIELAHKMESQLKSLNINCVVIDEFNKPFTLSLFQSNKNKIDLIKALEMIIFSFGIIITTPNIFFTFIPNIETLKQQFILLNKKVVFRKTILRLISMGK